MKCKLFPPLHMVSLPLGFKHPRAQLVYDKPNPEEVRRQLARALTSMGEHPR
jgi:ribosomal protein L29